MRTTLAIDDDVLAAVKERARREGKTAGEVLSDLARRQLTQTTQQAGRTRNGLPVLPSRGTPVTNELIDRLRAQEGL
ncbi:MAG: ribbon-helix-helix domain-containing protein [Austwickia sp.]|nr:ribbon-helix-helix domain-containing protein [Actinomycetota bacterium]MCB1252803.1 ribbon-helix-helix protein, CopG family [Austwickia sp.]MCO5309117.1 ribbon-helix-helix domain-containing protein [Austwickia sp.]